MSARTVIARVAIALALLATLALVGRVPNVAYVPTAPAQCTEDMPCWDCESMGNHICGRGQP